MGRTDRRFAGCKERMDGMMDELAANRTPVVIASEINTLKRQMVGW
ncbi:hypothetical protein [Desulfosporosinus hippei]|nr:hypothetical protein [Desulfosporosinus hippei]